jgi:low affinity Fe/Cu permease
MTSTHVPGNHAGLRSRLNDRFSHFAQTVAAWTGHPLTFLLAVTVVVVWVVTGPIFGYSDGWQLVINTGTTIVTFLMVFLIQNTQNRDILTLQLKLSELVLSMKDAEDRFASIEDLSDEELQELHEECRARAEMTFGHLERRRGLTQSGETIGRNGAHGKSPPAPKPKRQGKPAAARKH